MRSRKPLLSAALGRSNATTQTIIEMLNEPSCHMADETVESRKLCWHSPVSRGTFTFLEHKAGSGGVVAYRCPRERATMVKTAWTLLLSVGLFGAGLTIPTSSRGA